MFVFVPQIGVSMMWVSDFLGKIANLKILIVAGLVFALFPGYFLPRHQAQTESYSSGVGFVDLCFFPETERIYEIAEAYGEEGRRATIASWLTLDIIWPLVSSFFFLVCLNLCLGKVHGTKGSLLSLAALLPLIFDYGENLMGILVMTAYPERLQAAALGMSAFNGLKWVSFGVVGVLLLYGLGALAIRFFFKQSV
jgi:hypothetical protein